MAKQRKRVRTPKSKPEGVDTQAKLSKLFEETTAELVLELRRAEKRAEASERKLAALQLRLSALLTEPQRETSRFCFPHFTVLEAEAEYAANLLDILWNDVKDMPLDRKFAAMTSGRFGVPPA